jgi:CRISPR-associated endonuclease Csn1
MAKKYLMGLDLGTDSVGWCVTDEENHIVRKGGKSLWGVRLFEEAEDCSARRMSRESRRRFNRRNERIDLLQAIFAPQMNKVDPKFFIRMNNSFLHEEDKAEAAKGTDGTLFAGVGGLTDKDFYKRFPTIYHLRKFLLESDEKADIRYLYLAFHHMVKYRGNFLHYKEKINTQSTDEILHQFETIDAALLEMGKQPLGLDQAKVDQFFDLAMRVRGINDSKRAYANLFGGDDSFVKNALCPLLAGGKVALEKIFDLDDDEEPDPKAISVRDANFEEGISKIEAAFAGRPETKIILAAKAISDFVLLKKLLGSSASLSAAMVGRYDMHKRDLKALKAYVRAHCREKYDLVFRKYDSTLNNYVRYVGMNSVAGVRQRVEHCSREEFYAFLKKEVFGIAKNQEVTDPEVQKILQAMDEGDYLPRQNSTDNGVFPYQLNEQEMNTIIKQQAKYYPFFKDVDEEGYSNAQKIVSILDYHIPYYVGPLMAVKEGDDRSKFAWVTRTEKKIMPWNFEDGRVDFDASAQSFIQRMLNKCTYLPDCYCLPKSSLLYSRYEVVSFLNNIAINGRPLPAHSTDPAEVSKDELFAKVFSKGRVTLHSLVSYLKSKYGKFDDSLLTFIGGKQVDEIPCSLQSYADFVGIFGQDYVEKHLNEVEGMIRDLTIFTDRGIIERRLKNVYHLVDEQKIRRVKNLSYSGFGRLSGEFLNLTSDYLNKDTGEIVKISLIDAMYETGMNIMQLLNSSQFQFGSEVAEREKDYAPANVTGKSNLEQVKAAVDDLYVSPSLKRPLLQAYEIVDEVKKILGRPIDEYYVECTRGESVKDKGKKKPSRLDNLLDLYAEAKKESVALLTELSHKENLSFPDAELKKQILENQSNLDDNYQRLLEAGKDGQNLKFRSDKLFFYYIQLGRCMYSLKPIDLESLYADDQMYDIDHIIPQAITKDDSLSNRVLVYQDYNRAKKDKYPLPADFVAPGARAFYRYLNRLHLIDEKKLKALTRSPNNPLTDDEIQSFTNRQLVSTNQAVIGLISILKRYEKINGKEPAVIYSKAGLVSDFRAKFDILKSRDANDFHHAHDAYLNIVVGRANNEYFRFMNGKGWFTTMHEGGLTTNPNRIFDEPSENAKAHGHDKKPIKDTQGNICWNYSKSLAEIEKNVYHRFDVMVTIRQYYQTGYFGHVTIRKKEEWNGNNLFPVKKGLNPAIYGGYNNLVNGFFALLRLKSKSGGEKNTLLAVPNLVASPNETEKILAYGRKILGSDVESVILGNLKINSLIEIGKMRSVLSGKNTEKDLLLKSYNQIRFSKKEIATIRKTSKLRDIFNSHINNGVNPKNADFDQKMSEILGSSENSEWVVVSPAANEKKNQAIIITSGEEEQLYDVLAQKLASPLFAGMGGPSRIGEMLLKPESKAIFQRLSVLRKSFLLSEVLKEIKAFSADYGDFTLLNGPSKSKRDINTTLPSGTRIICQSITGYYDKVVWTVK